MRIKTNNVGTTFIKKILNGGLACLIAVTSIFGLLQVNQLRLNAEGSAETYTADEQEDSQLEGMDSKRANAYLDDEDVESEIDLKKYFKILGGIAKLNPEYHNQVELVNGQGDSKSIIWSKNKVDLTKKSRFSSYIFLNGGADGLTFVLQNDPRGLEATGSWGAGLGVYDYAGEPGIANGLVYEIDTFMNDLGGGYGTYDKGLTGVPHFGFVETNKMNVLGNGPGGDLHEGVKYEADMDIVWDEWQKFLIDWEPDDNGISGKLQVKLGKSFTQTYDIPDYRSFFKLENNESRVYWGMTATTGAETQISKLAIMELPQQPMINVETNVQDIQGKDLNGQKVKSGTKMRYTVSVEEVSDIWGAASGKILGNIPEHTKYAGNAVLKNETTGESFPLNIDKQAQQIEVTLADFGIEVLGNKISITYDVEIDEDIPTPYDIKMRGVFEEELLNFNSNNTVSTTVFSNPSITFNPQVVNLKRATGQNVDFSNGLIVKDDYGNDISSKATVKGEVDVNKNGVYPIQYSVVDEYGFETTAIRYYVVGSINNPQDPSHYAIWGEDFSIPEYSVDLLDPNKQIEELAKISSKRVSDGVTGSPIISGNDGYSKKPRAYQIKVKESKDLLQTPEGTFIANVIPNAQPTLSSPKYVELPIGSPIPERKVLLESVVLGGDDELTKNDIVMNGKNGIINKNPTKDDIDTNVEGVYTVKYTVRNSAGLEATSYTHYVVGSKVLDEKYAFFAHHFNIERKIVETSGVAKETQIKKYAQTKVYNLDEKGIVLIPETTTATIINDGGYTNKVGPYAIELGYKGSIDHVTIVGNVFEYQSQEDLGKTLLLDMIPKVQIKASKAQQLIKNGASIVDEGFLNATAWEKNTTRTVPLKEPINYITPDDLKSPDTVTAGKSYEVKVSLSKDVEKIGIIEILKDGDPQLEVVPDVVEIEKGKPLKNLSLMDGVTAKDGVIGVAPPKISTKLLSSNGVTHNVHVTDLSFINVQENGVYRVEYAIKDSQNIAKKAIRTYIVGQNPVVDKQADVVLFADNYIIDTMKTDGSQGVKAGDYVVQPQSYAQTEAFELSTTKPLSDRITMDLNENKKFYADNSNEHSQYKQKIQGKTELYHATGAYPLTFQIRRKDIFVRKSIVASVVGPTTIHKGNVAIDMQDAILRRSEVQARKANEISQVKVWNTLDGTEYKEKQDYSVESDGFDLVNQPENFAYREYHISVTEHVSEEKLSNESTITIVPGGAPFIEYSDAVDEADGHISLTLEEAEHLDSIVTGPHIKGAWDEEDTGGKDFFYPRDRIKLASDGGFNHKVPGTYISSYTVTDDDFNKATKPLTYLIGAANYSKKDAIYAHDVVVPINQLQKVENITQFVQEKSNVHADAFIFREDGLIIGSSPIPLSDVTLVNTDKLTSLSPIGGYKIQFTTPNGTKANIIVHVVDSDTSLDGRVYIHAKNVVKRPGQVGLTDTAAKLTEVIAWDSITGERITPPLLEMQTTFYPKNISRPMPQATTVFPVVFSAPTIDVRSKKEVTITINNGEAPVINNEKDVIFLKKGETDIVQIKDAVKISDYEDDIEGNPPVLQASEDHIDTNKKGVVRVTYSGNDSDGNQAAPKYRSYVIGANDVQPGDSIAIFANNFFAKKEDIVQAASSNRLDNFVQNASGYFAQNVATGNPVVDVSVAYPQAFKNGEVGPHDITITAKEGVIEKTIIIKAIVYDKGEAIGDVVIEADNRTIRLGDIEGDHPTLVDAFHLLDAGYKIQAWDINGSEIQVSATHSAPSFTKEVGDYRITLSASNRSIDRMLRVQQIDTPILKVDAPLVLLDGKTSVDIDEIMQGVVIQGSHPDTDYMLQQLKSKLQKELIYLNTRKEGVYVVTYQVEDLDGKLSNIETRTFVVGEASIAEDAVIFGGNAIFEQKVAPGIGQNGNQETNISEILKKYTKAKAFDRKADTKVSIVEKEELDIVVKSDGYTNKVGGYLTTITINDTEFTGKAPVRNVVLSVLDNDNGSGKANQQYGVQAFNRSYRPSKTQGISLIELMQAQAWSTVSAESERVTATISYGGKELTDNEWQSLDWHKDGTYVVSASSGKGESKLMVQVNLTIQSAEAPTISFANNPVIMDLGSSPVDTMAGVTVNDDFDALDIHDVQVSQDTISASRKGVYVVSYTVIDSDRNVTTATRSFIVRDEVEDGIGSKYAVFATNFVKYEREVSGSEPEALDFAHVEVQHIETGAKELPTIDAVNSSLGGYSNRAGYYQMDFVVKKDSKAKARIIASVIDDTMPLPKDDDEVIITATNFHGRPQDAKGKDAKTLVSPRAWHRRINHDYTSDVQVHAKGYNQENPAQGEYDAIVGFDQGFTKQYSEAKRSINLSSGEIPLIKIQSGTEIIDLPIDAQLTEADIYQGISVEDDDVFNPGRIGTILGEQKPGEYYADAMVDTSKRGVQIVKYTAKDNDGNVANPVQRAYVIGALQRDENYAIFGKNFSEKTNEMTLDEQEINRRTASYGVRLIDGVRVRTKVVQSGAKTYLAEARKSENDRMAGAFPIRIQIVDAPTVQATVFANVTKYSQPIDDVIYYIDAQSTTLLKSHVNGRDIDALTGIKSWNGTTGETITYQPISGQGEELLRTVDKPFTGEVGTYDVTYTVAKDGVKQKELTVQVTIESGDAPTISVEPDVQAIPLGTDIQTVDIFNGVVATDAQDTPVAGDKYPVGGWNVTENEHGKVYATGVIDTNNTGVYTVQYNVKDSDDNQAITQYRSYVVGGVVGNNYALFGHNFSIKKGSVDVINSNDQILKLSESSSSLWHAPFTKGTPEVKSNGGYRAAIGSYEIILSVKEEPNTTKTIRANVHEGVEGDEDIMSAHDVKIRLSELHQTTLEEVMGSRAWEKNTGNLLEYSSEITTESGEEVQFADIDRTGKYTVTFTTVPGGTTLTRYLDVYSGNAPVIEYTEDVKKDGTVLLTLDEAKGLDILSQPHIDGAWDEEDTGGKGHYYQDNRIRLVDDGGIDVTKKGIYLVKYEVTDNDSNTTQKTVTYILGSNGRQGEDVIFSDPYTVEQKELQKVTNIEHFVKEGTHVQAWKLVFDINGLVESKVNIPLFDIQVKELGTLTPASDIGPYTVVFSTPKGAESSSVISVVDAHTATEGSVYIYAKDAFRRPSQVHKTDVASVLTEVRAWNKETGEQVTLQDRLREDTQYNPTKIVKPMPQKENRFLVTYTVIEDPSSRKEVTITIDNGEKPVIHGVGQVVQKEIGESIDVRHGLTVTDKEDDEELIPVELHVQPESIDTDHKGITTVLYDATDSDGNKANQQSTHFVVGSIDPDLHDAIAIFADNFAIKKSEVTSSTNINKLILDRSHASAREIATSSEIMVEVADSTSFAAGGIGPHVIELRATKGSMSKTVKIIGSIYEHGEIVDDTIIEAKNRTVRVGDLPEKPNAYDVLNFDPEDSSYKIIGWKMDGSIVPVKVINETPIFVKETDLSKLPKEYTITLEAQEKTIDRKIKVVKAENPVITLSQPFLNREIGSKISIADVMDGVKILHQDTGVLTDQLTGVLNEQLKTVDTSKNGVITISYFVIDADGNESNTVTKNILIGPAIFNNDAAIFSKNFTQELKDVTDTDELGNQGKGLPETLVKLSQSSGFDLQGTEKLASIVQKRPLSLTASTMNYKKVTGGYPITVRIADDSFHGKSPEVQVVGSIVNNYNGGHAEEGNVFITQGTDSTYHPAEANGKSLIELVDAKAWDKTTSFKSAINISAIHSETGEELSDQEWVTTWPVDGLYHVKISTGQGMQRTQVSVNLTIKKSKKPNIAFDKNPVILDLGSGEVDTLEGVSVTDDIDQHLVVIPSSQHIKTDHKGVYLVTYYVEDSDRNSVERVRSYIVRDKDEDGVGQKYAIFATNFVKHAQDVQEQDAAVSKNARLKVQEITTGRGMSTDELLENVSFDLGGYTNIPSPYKMTFSLGQEPIAARIVASVIDDTVKLPAASDTTILTGENFSGLPTEVKNKDIVDEVVKGQSWNRKNGKRHDVTFEWIGASYEIEAPIQGAYKVDLRISDTTVSGYRALERDINLQSGEKPVIAFIGDTEVVHVKLGEEVDVLSDILATDAEEGTFTQGAIITPSTVEQPLKYYASNDIDTTKEGIQKVTYSAKDSDGNKANPITRYYVIGSESSNKEFALFASNFHERVDQMTFDDRQIINKAHAYGIEIKTGKKVDVQLTYNGARTYKEEASKLDIQQRSAGSYPIKMQLVVDPAVVTTIFANVTKYNTPDVNAKYYIDAKNVVILKSHVGLQQPNTLTEVKSWNAKTGEQILLSSEGNSNSERLVMEENPAFTDDVGIYEITYHVLKNEQIVQSTTVKIEVIAGNKPVIQNDFEVVHLSLGQNIAEEQLFDGVQATDAEDTPQTNQYYEKGGWNVAQKEQQKLYVDGIIDTSVAGVYVIEYNVVDSDSNAADTSYRSYIVDGSSGTDYALFGNDFTVEIGAVDVLETNQQILDMSSAKAINWMHPDRLGTPVVGDDGGYTKSIGSYPINLQVKEEPETAKSIRGNVHEGTVGAIDIMSAHDGKVRPSEITSKTVKEVTGSQAWNWHTGEQISYTITVKNNQGMITDFTGKEPLGTYTVYFETINGTTLERKIEVVSGEKPEIKVFPHVVDLYSSRERLSINYLDGVEAKDIEDTGDKPYPHDRIHVEGNVNLAQPDWYNVGYSVVDDDGNKSEENRIYLVDPQNFDEQDAIFGHDFIINDVDVASNLGEQEEQLKQLGELVARRIESGSFQDVQIADKGGYSSDAGTYEVQFHVLNNEYVKGLISVHVMDTTAPDMPIFERVTAGDRSISGTSEPFSTVEVTLPGDEKEQTVANEHGDWMLTVPEHVELKWKESILAIAIDGSGNSSERAHTVVEPFISYEISAHNITIDIADLNELKASNKLDNYIRKEAEVTVIKHPMEESLDTFSLDMSQLTDSAVKIGNEYTVTAIFVPSEQTKNNRTIADAEDETKLAPIEKSFKVQIVGSKMHPKTNLPVSGEYGLEYILISVLLVIGGVVLVILGKRRKDAKKKSM